MKHERKRELTGKTDGHVLQVAFRVFVHCLTKEPLQALKKDAAEAGFDLAIASGFRSYERQKDIWEAKARGERPLFDEEGRPFPQNGKLLTPQEKVYAICRWSALPGASRHHWGTDLDVYDKNALPSPDYRVQLSLEEVAPGGIFAPFHQWLDQKIRTDSAHGFFRPYAQDRGGVGPERWHISFAPLAQDYERDFTFEFFRNTMEEAALFLLQDTVCAHAQDLYQQFVLNKGPKRVKR